MKAIWNNEVIAEAEKTVIIDGNHYFPKESLKNIFFENSDTTSNCHWKGEANYYIIVVNGETNKDAAWVYHTPSKLAEAIKDHVAFWKGVKVVE
jgi:uncharacterized protein (DUF427 family)